MLRAVAVLGPDDAWAVGSFHDAMNTSHPLVLHWDGRAWALMPAPHPASDGAELGALAAIGANDVWVIGGLYYHPLLAHWDGRAWQRTVLPDQMHLNAIAALSSRDIWVVGDAAGPADAYGPGPPGLLALHWDGQTWRAVATPSFGFTATLSGIAARAPDDVWAVGNNDIGGEPEGNYAFVAHWDGQAWREVKSGQIGPGSNAGLAAITARARDDAWAVGGGYPALVLHWTGQTWEFASLPDADTTGQPLYGWLVGVAAVAGDDVWAVGGQQGDSAVAGAPTRTLILHYGVVPCVTRSPTPTPSATPSPTSTPTVTPSATPSATRTPRLPLALAPGPTFTTACGGWQLDVGPGSLPGAPDSLAAVGGSGPGDLWAVGDAFDGAQFRPLTLHWDGTSWTQIALPVPGRSGSGRLEAVTALAGDDAWVVGHFEGWAADQESLTLTMHWDGAAWRLVLSPNSPLGKWNRLTGVAAVSANDVWAVGSAVNEDQHFSTVTLHWDGGTWRVVPSPNPGLFSNELYAVAALTSDDVWAVGSASIALGQRQPLIEHWDGRQWLVVPGPTTSPGGTFLSALAALAPDNIWAAGGDDKRTLIYRWDGTAWRQVPSPNVPGYNNGLLALAARAPDDIWATGGLFVDGYLPRLLALHWDGATWHLVAGPPNLGLALGSLISPAPGELWGAAAGADRAAILRYSGQPCPAPTDYVIPVLPTMTSAATRPPPPTLPPPVPTDAPQTR